MTPAARSEHARAIRVDAGGYIGAMKLAMLQAAEWVEFPGRALGLEPVVGFPDPYALASYYSANKRGAIISVAAVHVRRSTQ